MAMSLSINRKDHAFIFSIGLAFILFKCVNCCTHFFAHYGEGIGSWKIILDRFSLVISARIP